MTRSLHIRSLAAALGALSMAAACGAEVETSETLASDQALHVTGQVFRAVGSTIARYQPWTLQEELVNPKGDEQWDPNHIGPIVNSYVFNSRNPGLQMGAMRKGTK